MVVVGKRHQFDWDEGVDAAANARTNLSPLLASYFTHMRKLLGKNPSPPELHRLRLETKKLRYTLELFRPCYGPGLETRLAQLRNLQRMLGEVNDSAATVQLLGKSMRPSAERTRVETFLGTRAAEKAEAFRKHWTEVFDAQGCEGWWTTYLERQARAPGPRMPRAH